MRAQANQHLRRRLATCRRQLASLGAAGEPLRVRDCVLAAQALLPKGEARRAPVPDALREWLHVWLIGGQPGSVRHLTDGVFRVSRLLTLATGEAPPSHPSLCLPLSVGLSRECGERALEAWLASHAAELYRFLGELEDLACGPREESGVGAWRSVVRAWYQRQAQAISLLTEPTALH